MIFPECYAFYSEKFCKFCRSLFHKCLYPQLLNSSINFTKPFFPCEKSNFQKFFFCNYKNFGPDKRSLLLFCISNILFEKWNFSNLTLFF